MAIEAVLLGGRHPGIGVITEFFRPGFDQVFRKREPFSRPFGLESAVRTAPILCVKGGLAFNAYLHQRGRTFVKGAWIDRFLKR